MSHTYKSGTIYLPNGKIYCTYGTDTAASANEASATASSTHSVTMAANIEAYGWIDGRPAPVKKREMRFREQV